MVFAQARDSEFAPYLLDFRGTPGERHVENLKVSVAFFPFLLLTNDWTCILLDIPRSRFSLIHSRCRPGLWS